MYFVESFSTEGATNLDDDVETSGSVWRVEDDGSDMVELYTYDHGYPVGLDIYDFTERLYWVDTQRGTAFSRA